MQNTCLLQVAFKILFKTPKLPGGDGPFGSSLFKKVINTLPDGIITFGIK